MAQRLGFRLLDTGAMYRAVTLMALQNGVRLEDEEGLVKLARSLTMELVPADGGERLMVDGEDVTDQLHSPEVGGGVSLVARVRGVRADLVEKQRDIARGGPTVMAGRDIGTVVLPDAPVKVYLTAGVEVRARRRFLELQGGPENVTQKQVLSELTHRDKMDSERAASPLRPAEDAVVIDTDDLGLEGLVQQILALVGHS